MTRNQSKIGLSDRRYHELQEFAVSKETAELISDTEIQRVH